MPKREEPGSERLLAAARKLLGERLPSSISTRVLAKEAGVHHTLATYTHGGIAALLAAAFARERSRFAATLTADGLKDTGALPLSRYPDYWRAYLFLALDTHDLALQQMAAVDHTVPQVCGMLRAAYPGHDPETSALLAVTWWTLQIGALVFEEPLCRGLSIADRDRGAIRTLLAGKLAALADAAPDTLPWRPVATVADPDIPPDPATGRKAAEERFVQAAIGILREQSATGVSGRELARRAGANYGLIHHYFGSKEAVFDAAFVRLHERYVRDMVAEETQRLADPFSMRSHEAFLRIWAHRELAGIAMPEIDLKGMRLLVDNAVRRRNIARRAGPAYREAQASAYCSLALQLGWVVCRRDLGSIPAIGEDEALPRLAAIARRFVAGDWD